MDKQAQDKLWNDLSEEKKKEYRKEFQQESESYHQNVKHCDRENEFEYNTGYSNGVISTLEELFGEHNLNPAPQIKTWEDVEKLEYSKIEHHDMSMLIKGVCGNIYYENINEKVVQKVIATLKIAKLIDLGYGGMVSEEEWKDGHLRVYTILPTEFEGEFEIANTNFPYRAFLSFHTQQQAEEFISHESNKILVRQYYLM